MLDLSKKMLAAKVQGGGDQAEESKEGAAAAGKKSKKKKSKKNKGSKAEEDEFAGLDADDVALAKAAKENEKFEAERRAQQEKKLEETLRGELASSSTAAQHEKNRVQGGKKRRTVEDVRRENAK